MGDRIIATTIDPKPTGTLKENVTISFSHDKVCSPQTTNMLIKSCDKCLLPFSCSAGAFTKRFTQPATGIIAQQNMVVICPSTIQWNEHQNVPVS